MTLVPPALLMALLCGIFLHDWLNAESLKREMFSRFSMDLAEEVGLRVSNLLVERVNDLALLAEVVGQEEVAARLGIFRERAEAVALREPSYHVINYVSPDSVILASLPEGRRPELLGLDLKTLPGREALHRKVSSGGVPLASPPITLTSGRPGMVIWYPVPVREGEKSGMIAGTMHLDTILEEVIVDSATEDFQVRLLVDGDMVYSSAPPTPPYEDLRGGTGFLDLGRLFDIEVRPLSSGSLMAIGKTNTLHLALGLLISLLSSVFLYFAVLLANRAQAGRKALEQTQSELVAQRDTLTGIFEGVPIGLTLWGGDGALLKANNSFFELTGYGPDEVDTLEKWFVLAYPDPDYRNRVTGDWQADREGVEGHREFQVAVRHGEPKTIEFRAAFLADGSSLVTLTDNTERKKSETAREELIAELERFTYTVSHDLKNPIITIKGFLGLVRQNLMAGKTEELPAQLDRIDLAADRMGQLLDELLELSRIGRLDNAFESVPLEEVVREACELLEVELSQRGAKVSIADPLPVVSVDRVRMREVFQNLIDNALKFTARDLAPNVIIGCREAKGRTVFYVADDGIGVNPRYAAKIFNLFEQVNPDQGGTGIGLALVKRIVESHGGTIWLESEGEGKGCTFCFTLHESSK